MTIATSQADGVQPQPTVLPPAKAGCSPGCKTFALLVVGMLLGSTITIVAEIALVATGVSWVGRAISGSSSSMASQPATNVQEPVPTEFNGVSNDTLDSLCNSAVLDPKISEGCRQRKQWICNHGGPCSAF